MKQISRYRVSFLRCIATALVACTGLLASGSAQAQALNVVPVTIAMAPGQRAAAVTVTNQGNEQTSFQLRAFAWSQAADGSDMLVASDEIMLSPPLGTIAPGASQVIRLVLRPNGISKEGSYRLWLDQIPAPAAPGTVRVALRLSLPVFAQPATRTTPNLHFRVERAGDEAYLVALNDGNRHEKLQGIALQTPAGAKLRTAGNVSPYILAGATRRWRLEDKLPADVASLRLNARAEVVKIIDQRIAVAASF